MTRARDLSKLLGTNNNGVIDNTNITLDANEIPNLDTAKITTGTFADARISAGSVSQHVDLSNLNASNLTSGTIASARINNSSLSAISALPAGVGGKVLQVVNADTGTQVNTTSTSFVNTNLTASITPSSASNKILVIINQSCAKNNSDVWCVFQILRNATQIGGNPSGESIGWTGNADYNFMGMTYNVNFLDTPSTTSSVTYKTQFKTQGSNGVRVQPDGCKSFITLIEIAG